MNTRRFFARRASLGLMAFAALVALAAPAAWADPPIRAARLNYVTGPVLLAPAGLPDEWGEAFVNRPITTGDRLWADSGGRAEVRLGSTALRIDGGTLIDVLDVDRLLQVAIDQGRAHVRTRGGAGGNAEIDTPAAAVVVNAASDVRVDVDGSSGRTSITVRFGRANVYTQNGDSFDLASGETTRIDADGRYYSIGRVGPRDNFDNFAYVRDRRWREPRYVSVEMTGYEDLDSYGSWQPATEYGNVWFPRQVAADWVPYRDGRWVWVEPWGWTWVDNAPWGFAPFHYGRWVQVNNRWGWWPGERVVTPVYAPALVAFFGGEGLGVSVSVGAGPAVGWFPLGYRDPYIPWYTASPTYRRNVNVAYVRDPVVLNQVVNVTNINVTNVTNIRYAYRDRGNVATVVPRQAFVTAQPVRPVAVSVPVQQMASASIIAAAPAAPERASFTGRQGRSDRSDRAPRADRVSKPVVAVNAPAAAPPRFEQRAQEAQQAQGKPFEVKPLRDDRRDARSDAPNRTAQPAAQPGAAPTATATAPTGRDVRVIKPGATDSRQARDRGARPDNAAEGRTAPGQDSSRANVTPSQALPPQAAQQAQERAVPAQGLPPQAAPQAQDRAAPQREAQQREAQQREAQQRDAQQRDAQQREQRANQEREQRANQEREQRANQEREQQQRASDERAKGQREAQERAAQQRDEQQRAAEERAKGQRDAQERANQQREQQKSAAEERAKGQREAQERATQERANQQREQQQRAAEERAKGQREAQERATQQREQQQRATEERAKGQRDAQERANQQRMAQQQAQAQAQAEAQARRAQQQPAPQPQAEPKAAPGSKGGRDKADDREDREEKERGKGGERRG